VNNNRCIHFSLEFDLPDFDDYADFYDWASVWGLFAGALAIADFKGDPFSLYAYNAAYAA